MIKYVKDGKVAMVESDDGKVTIIDEDMRKQVEEKQRPTPARQSGGGSDEDESQE
jgi:predicted site-specific integrase-resolvase